MLTFWDLFIAPPNYFHWAVDGKESITCALCPQFLKEIPMFQMWNQEHCEMLISKCTPAIFNPGVGPRLAYASGLPPCSPITAMLRHAILATSTGGNEHDRSNEAAPAPTAGHPPRHLGWPALCNCRVHVWC